MGHDYRAIIFFSDKIADDTFPVIGDAYHSVVKAIGKYIGDAVIFHKGKVHDRVPGTIHDAGSISDLRRNVRKDFSVHARIGDGYVMRDFTARAEVDHYIRESEGDRKGPPAVFFRGEHLRGYLPGET